MEKKIVQIKVPTDWSAVTLREYLALKKDMDAYQDEPEAVIACMFHHLCQFPVEYVQKLDLETYNAIVNDLTSFIQKIELPLQREINVEGVDYGFEPNLSTMAYGAYVDISKYKTMEINEDWAEIMSILYRPIVKRSGQFYDIQPYSGYLDKETFLDVTMDVHFGAIFFFKTLLNVLLNTTLNSLTEEMRKAPNMQSILAKSGEVIAQLSNSQTEMLQKLKK